MERYVVERAAGDIAAVAEVYASVQHFSGWNVELQNLVLEPNRLVVMVSGPIPANQKAHLNIKDWTPGGGS